MNITLDRDVEDFLQGQIRAGVCDTPGKLINDLVRSIRDQQQRPFDVTPELEKWLLEAADKPTTPLTPDDFAGIRARAAAPAIRGMSVRKSDDFIPESSRSTAGI